MEWLMYILHLALTNVGAFWVVFTFFMMVLAAVLTFGIGSIRWWTISHTTLPQRWARYRRELNKVIASKDKIIAEQAEEIHFYKHRSYVAAVAMLQNEAEKEIRNEA